MADRSLDPWQFSLSGSPMPGSLAVGSFWLNRGFGLPVVQVSDDTGRAAGFLLGFPIDLARRQLIGAEWQAPLAVGGDRDGFSLALLRALGGRFLWIETLGQAPRIFPDCSAQVTCVYDPVARVAGSTAYALFDAGEYSRRFDRTLFDRLGVDGEGWFPAGLTAHRGLSRLLPNHCLDLGTWQIRRFWPLSDPGVTDDPEATVDAVIDAVQRQIEALIVGPKRVGMALTAGHETRMLLACVRPYLKDVDFVTVSGGDRHEVDTVMARRIAKDMGLNHIALPRQVATTEQRELFIVRGGHCNADSNARYHPSVWPIAQSHVFVGGVGGEVARAFFWRASDTAESAPTAQIMAGRFGLPAYGPLVSALEHWKAGLPAMDARQMLDLAYLEHRDGAWYAAQFCCDPTLLRLAPLLTFGAVERMIQLPADWKLTDRLGHAVIARLWPELERYPYNSLGRWRDLGIKLQKVAQDPRIVLKKLRKLRS